MPNERSLRRWPHIAAIGVELEGAWDDLPQGWKEDGSVRVDGTRVTDGEVASPRLTTPAAVKHWILGNHPDRVNESCGLHIHVSTDPAPLYGYLITARLWGDCISFWAGWGERHGLPESHPFWYRLGGANEYCRQEWRPEVQLGTVPNDGAREFTAGRYTMLNFEAYERHGTLELRILPMFNDSSLTADAVLSYTRWLSKWLTAEIARPQQVVERELSMDFMPIPRVLADEEEIPPLSYQDIQESVQPHSAEA